MWVEMDSNSIPYEFNMRLLKFLQNNLPLRKVQKMKVNISMTKRNCIKHSVIKRILNRGKNKLLSLRQIRELYYKEDRSIKFSIDTLRKFMRQQMGITHRIRQVRGRNYFLEKNSVMRRMFIKKMTELLMNNYLIIYIDEAGVGRCKPLRRQWVFIDESEPYFLIALFLLLLPSYFIN
jgi:hypothetical protein